MGQISIPVANKVGYSMYWSSMWDNKINFSRSFKEDIYLSKFINLLFNDLISSNVIIHGKEKSKKNFRKYYIHFKNTSNFTFRRYTLKKNSFIAYPAKTWILKYQNWIVIYYFVYLPYFNRLNKITFNKRKKIELRSVFDVYANYLKANEKVNLSFFLYQKNFKLYF